MGRNLSSTPQPPRHWDAAHAKLVVMDRRRPPKDTNKLEIWKPSWKYQNWHLFGGFTMDFWKENHGSFLLPNLLGFDWLKSQMKSPFWGMALATIGDPGLNHCTTISNRMLRRCTVFGTIQNPGPSWRHKISNVQRDHSARRSVEWLFSYTHQPARRGSRRISGGTLSQGSRDWKDQNLAGSQAADLGLGISWHHDHEKHCRLIICSLFFFSLTFDGLAASAWHSHCMIIPIGPLDPPSYFLKTGD